MNRDFSRELSEEENIILKWIDQEELDDRGPGSRKGSKPDKRFYIMGLLHYKHKWSESRIANVLFISNRSSISYGKNKPFERKGDKKFIEHTKALKKAFPFEFPPPSTTHDMKAKITNKNYGKIRRFKKDNRITESSDSYVMNFIIDKFL